MLCRQKSHIYYLCYVGKNINDDNYLCYVGKNDISTNKLVLPTKPRIQKLILDHLKKWVTYFPSVADIYVCKVLTHLFRWYHILIKKRNGRPLVLVHSCYGFCITAFTCLAYQRPSLDRGFEFLSWRRLPTYMLSVVIRSQCGYPAMLLSKQLVHYGLLRPGPLVLRKALLKILRL